ncbi:hypothetical protein PIB30_011435 [Stylosanthes scabra]|uniref:Uncharacterized protein n=1 Tax=Stylosanthes scabra TaxID=79078 RepID=A0ABU6Q5Y1_9FABA|nr:hypothetical protein [Stylosanthes scabra]
MTRAKTASPSQPMGPNFMIHGYVTEASTATASEEPYCKWSPKMAGKSNSMRFSKLWKLRDQKLRSNSNDKDAFVFLNSPLAVKTKKAGCALYSLLWHGLGMSTEDAKLGMGSSISHSVSPLLVTTEEFGVPWGWLFSEISAHQRRGPANVI